MIKFLKCCNVHYLMLSRFLRVGNPYLIIAPDPEFGKLEFHISDLGPKSHVPGRKEVGGGEISEMLRDLYPGRDLKGRKHHLHLGCGLWVGFLKSCFHESGQSTSGAAEE